MDESLAFAVVLEPDPDGGYTAIVPALPGVVTEGETVQESLANARDAIALCIEDMRGQGLPIPESDDGTPAVSDRSQTWPTGPQSKSSEA